MGGFLLIPGAWAMFSRLPETLTPRLLSIFCPEGFALVPQVPALTVNGGPLSG